LSSAFRAFLPTILFYFIANFDSQQNFWCKKSLSNKPNQIKLSGVEKAKTTIYQIFIAFMIFFRLKKSISAKHNFYCHFQVYRTLQ